MSNSCETINVLDYQGFDLVRENSDCNAYKAGRKLFDDVANSTVLVETGNQPSPRPRETAKVGTGFFVNDGDEIVTNGHVGAIDSYVDVITNDGKHYHAKLEKLDDENDLALLKVIGIEKDPGRAIKLANNEELKRSDDIEVIGHPDGSSDPVLSPGVFLNHDKMLNLIPNPSSFPDLDRLIKLKSSTTDPLLAKSIDDYLNSDRIHTRMNIHHGDSGSPAVDVDGKLVGVVADRVSGAHALIVPVDKVGKLLSSSDSKFKFDYEEDNQHNQHLRSITRTDGSNLPPIILETK